MRVAIFLLIILAEAMTDKVCAANSALPEEDVLEQAAAAGPVYLEIQPYESDWKSNWFFSLQGGASAFIGSPMGCSDLWGRTVPAAGAAFGKWFTPMWGARASWQGPVFRNSLLDDSRYMMCHADLMYNTLGRVGMNSEGISSWQLAPYIGSGIACNSDGGRHPFTLNCGLLAGYRLSDHIRISMELAVMSTFGDFDGVGNPNRFGDNMYSALVGLSLTMGHAGWKRVADAAPYMTMADDLRQRCISLQNETDMLSRQHEDDGRIIEELRKILEIEGLLDRYGDRLAAGNRTYAGYPVNDYSGLNSLRRRMQDSGRADIPDFRNDRSARNDGDTLLCEISDTVSSVRRNDSVRYVSGGNAPVGAPIYFFFALATDTLTEEAQHVNLDELARVAASYRLAVRVTGAADSATGTRLINDSLSASRAEYIASQLASRGVDRTMITTVSEGGTGRYRPQEANRYTKVELMLFGD